MFIIIFNQLLKMLIIMLIAYSCFKLKVVNQEGNKNMANILLMVVNPCLVLTVYQVDFDQKLLEGLIMTFILAFITHIIAIIMSNLLISKKNNQEYALERFASMFSNCGFIGIPLINSILGNVGVFYISAYMIIFNLFTWTHGLILLKGACSKDLIKKGLMSPMIIASCISIILFIFQIKMPEVLLNALEYIGKMNTPLAMMVAGFSLAQTNIKKVFTKISIYKVSILKLIIMPLLTLTFLYLLNIKYDVAYTILLASACPSAATTTMMALRYNKNYQYGSELFAFTTIASILTIPLIVYLAEVFI